MIKYDYLIDRLTEKRKFGPVKPFANMHNFSVIRGKNAIGKSTLLHLLAYAFYGYDERSFKGQGNQINPVLKDKIYQFQSKDQTVKFNFELTDEVSGLRICSDKSDKEDFPGFMNWPKMGKRPSCLTRSSPKSIASSMTSQTNPPTGSATWWKTSR